MKRTRDFLVQMGLPSGDAHDLPTSAKRFPDGAQYRVEIPSVEGPKAFRALLEAEEEYEVLIHRISQGSGVMLLTDEEIEEMARLGREEGMEVSLFVGPRAAWDIVASPLTAAGRALAARAHGMEQLVYCLEDIKRACALGIRGVLIADEGLLWVANEMRGAGELPKELVIKISVQMGAANPASIRLMEDLGADTYNIPSDMTLAKIAAIRQAVDIPLDIYVEVPDDFGGFIRHYEIPEIIRVAAPVYLKFGLRNAPNIYPSGTHLEPTAIALTRERVRRAKLGLEIIRRYYPEATTSSKGAKGLAVPV